MIILTLIWYWRAKRKELLILKYKFELENLRNELRWRNINGQLNNESWIYLDHSIQIASNNLIYFNIYSAFDWKFISREDKKPNTVGIHYNEEFVTAENLDFKEFDKKLSGINLDFLIKKHGLIRFLLFILGKDKR